MSCIDSSTMRETPSALAASSDRSTKPGTARRAPLARGGATPPPAPGQGGGGGHDRQQVGRVGPCAGSLLAVDASDVVPGRTRGRDDGFLSLQVPFVGADAQVHPRHLDECPACCAVHVGSFGHNRNERILLK